MCMPPGLRLGEGRAVFTADTDRAGTTAFTEPSLGVEVSWVIKCIQALSSQYTLAALTSSCPDGPNCP